MPRSQREKTMSSRLLTMKFMQRAAAASTSTPTTPTGQKSAPESESPAPSPKRQRISNNNASSSDLRAISAAIRAEEEKRAAAIAKQAADAGETEWVLEFPAGTVKPAPKVVPDVEDEYEELEYGGRRSYGNYKKKTKAVAHTAANEQQNESGDDGEGDSDVLELINSEKSREESRRYNGKRQNRDSFPNGISSGGGRRSGEDDTRNITSISGGMSKEKSQGGGKRKGFR